MRKIASCLLLLAGIALGESKPPDIRISTWVREDLFAAFLTNDIARFEKGTRKLNAILSETPDAPDAVAWRGSGNFYRAVRAHEAGKAQEFKSLYAEALKDFERAAELAGKSPWQVAVFAIRGGSYTLFSDRLPERLRRAGWEQSRKNYLALREVQKAEFDRMPLHMRGEVLAGLAQAAQRLGEAAETEARLAEVIGALPGSPYAARARRWQEKPEIAATTSLTCQTCHEPGRLEAALSRR